MLKQSLQPRSHTHQIPAAIQPPSGGCVLKPYEDDYDDERVEPAAFGRLCVETHKKYGKPCQQSQPPSGGCVLKHQGDCQEALSNNQPPSGGCVLKQLPH